MSFNRRAFLTSAAATAALSASTATLAAPLRGPRRTADHLKVLIPSTPPEQLEALQAAAQEVELVVCQNTDEARDQIEDAHATYGFGNADLIQAGKNLRWIQWPSAGVENIVFTPELQDSDIVLTNMQRVYAPEIADQTLGYLLAFNRNIDHAARTNSEHEWPSRPLPFEFEELLDKTMLIVGLGGIGLEVARRAFGFGMNVLATDPKVWERPLFVAELHRPDKLAELLPRADVVVSAAPLVPETKQMFNSETFGQMKPGVLFVNVSRGGLADTEALVQALRSGHVAAAGLDVTDPEPLPKGHPLWDENVIITPHSAGQSPGGTRRRQNLFRENLARFARDEMLLNVVDKKVGY